MKQSCTICSQEFEGRSDRRWCSQPCRKSLKTLYDKAFHIDNREEKISRACAWQRANKDRKREYDRDRRDTLPRRVRAPYKEDPETRRMISAKRRASKRSQGAYTVTVKDLSRALDRARYRCVYCLESFTTENPLEWDHIIPISRGGSHSIGNLAPSCRDCNRSKQIKFIIEWRNKRVVCVRSL